MNWILFVAAAGLWISCGTSKKESVAEDMTEEIPAVPRIVGEQVDYQLDTLTMKGYLAYDANLEGSRPGIIVVHEWWGHDEFARKRADMLAELGYTALAVDMYGDGKNTDHPENAMKFMTEVVSNLEVGVSRFQKAVEVLKAHETTDANNVAAIGYCFGGAVVLHMARIGMDLNGVVSFHGDLTAHTEVKPGDIKSKILVCHGAIDPFVPAEVADAFKAEMDASGADYTFIAYDSAKHSFTNPGATAVGEKFELPLVYNQDADEQSWQAMQDFFNKIFAGS